MSSLGQALALCLATPETTLRSCLDAPDTTPKNPLSVAIARIHAALPDAFRDLFGPLKDKILKMDDEAVKARSHRLLSWILLGSSGIQFSDFLHDILIAESVDKRTKLAIALSMEFNITELRIALSSSSPTSQQMENSTCIRFLRHSKRFIPLFVEMIQQDGLFDADEGCRRETRLTGVCLSVVLDWFSLVLDCINVYGESHFLELENLLWDASVYLINLMACLRQYKKENKLWDTCLQNAHQFLNAISIQHLESNAASTETLVAYIKSLIRGCHPKVALYSEKKMRNLILKILEEDDMAGGFFQITSTCFTLSQRSVAKLETLLKNIDIEKGLFGLVSDMALHFKNSSGGPLGFCLLRLLLSVSGPERLKPIIDSLVCMLDEDEASQNSNSPDISTQTIAGLLAEYAVYYPEDVLRDVFIRIDSESKIKRRNGLLVLDEIFKVNKDFLSSTCDAATRKLNAILANHLLDRLADEDVSLRKNAALLFSHIDCHMIIPRLCKLVESENHRIRAAADVALVSTLSNHGARADAVVAFLDHIRSLCVAEENNFVPKSPGHVIQKSSVKQTPVSNDRIDLFLRLASKWSLAVDQKAWPLILPRLIKKAYASPEDSIIIRFFNAIIPAWTEPSTITLAFDLCLSIMKSQPRLELCLLENNQSDENALLVRDILFARLNPMLILKMIPVRLQSGLTSSTSFIPPSYWNSEHSEAESESPMVKFLIYELIKRIEHPVEFEEVRKVATEVLARLPIETVLPVLKHKLSDVYIESDEAIIRTYIFAACHVIAAHGCQSSDVIPILLNPIFDTLTYPFGMDTPSIQSIQQGCLECLSLMISTYCAYKGPQFEKTSSEQKPMIQEILDTDIDTMSHQLNISHKIDSQFDIIIDAILYFMDPLWIQKDVDNDEHEIYTHVKSRILDQSESHQASFALSTFMANVLTVTTKNMASILSGGNTKGVGDDFTGKTYSGLKFLASMMMKNLMDVCFCGICDKYGENGYVVSAASLQTLFHIVYFLKADIAAYLGELVDLSIQGLKSKNDLIRSSSMKLVGSILALSGTTVQKQCGPLRMIQIQRAIESVAYLDVDQQNRRLAEQYLPFFDNY